MNEPNVALMKCYGTSDVFKEKTAGEVPLIARLAAMLINAELAHSNQKGDEKARLDDALREKALEEYELSRLQPATSALKHTPVPVDESMVRLASIAVGIGSDLAKQAGIGTMAAPAAAGLLSQGKKWLSGGLGLKTNLALGAAGVGGAILGTKAIHAGTRALANTNGPPVYGMGHPVRNVGYQIPFGVNPYGQPQIGTPLG